MVTAAAAESGPDRSCYWTVQIYHPEEERPTVNSHVGKEKCAQEAAEGEATVISTSFRIFWAVVAGRIWQRASLGLVDRDVGRVVRADRRGEDEELPTGAGAGLVRDKDA